MDHWYKILALPNNSQLIRILQDSRLEQWQQLSFSQSINNARREHIPLNPFILAIDIQTHILQILQILVVGGAMQQILLFELFLMREVPGKQLGNTHKYLILLQPHVLENLEYVLELLQILQSQIENYYVCSQQCGIVCGLFRKLNLP
jgi:hypothetical protein